MKVRRNRFSLFIDGNSLAWRQHANPQLSRFTTGDGRKSGVFFGFLRTTRKLVERFKPEKLFVVFDGGGTYTGRKLIYPGYKASRRSTSPDSFVQQCSSQLSDLRKVLRSLGARVARYKDVEADDLIALYARLWAAGEGCMSAIVSSDRDFFQLVSPSILVYDDRASKAYDVKTVKKVLGVSPELVSYYKALVGDSDDIKGIPGYGPSKAISLLSAGNDSIFQKVPKKHLSSFLLNLSLISLPNTIGDLAAMSQNNKFPSESVLRVFNREPRGLNVKRLNYYLSLYECASIKSKLVDWSKPFRDLA